MSLNKLNIPKTITVGYQTRTDTYTNKLAYVIYTDNKGVLRKECSWNGWRDKKIDPETFDNVPTSGFVLNKGVGDTKYGWNPRKAWIRIYDPRGFEFEISVANTLFILEECSSIKGKGLEGEFVYSWDKSDLVLLPASSQEYKLSANHTELQTFKVTKNEMKEGCQYVNKEGNNVIYLGRHDWSEVDYVDQWKSHIIKMSTEKLHIFYDIDNKRYWNQKGFTKLASKVSDEVSNVYADLYESFMNSFNASTEFKFGYRKIKTKLPKNYYTRHLILKENNVLKRIEYYKHDNFTLNSRDYYTHSYEISEDHILKSHERYEYNLSINKKYTNEEFLQLDFYEMFVEDNKGNQTAVITY